MSREALQRFYQVQQSPNQTYCQTEHGAEDVEIGKCLRAKGVQVGKSLDENNRELFHPLIFHDHFRGSVPDWLIKNAENAVQSVSYCLELDSHFHSMNISFLAL